MMPSPGFRPEALVDVVPQRGTTVSLIKISDARENMFLRRAIEVEAVRAVTRNFSGDHLEALKQNLRYQSAAVASGDKLPASTALIWNFMRCCLKPWALNG